MTSGAWLADRIPFAWKRNAAPGVRMIPPMSKDTRPKRDLHALDDDGMVICNPRDKEAAHRAEMEGIATDHHAAVTCRKCLSLLYKRDTSREEGP